MSNPPGADQDLILRCTRWLSGHRPMSMRKRLLELAAAAPEQAMDQSGASPVVQALEARVATLLGKDSAIFLPKGVTAQLAALRAWTETTGKPCVALHPQSHIAGDEDDALEHVHRIEMLRVGGQDAHFGLTELESAGGGNAGAIVVELPLRRAGFRLMAWTDLAELSQWSRARRIPLHFDGARLWECQEYWGRSVAQIAALADSVYVSFYKGLGAIGGAALAGSGEFIAAARKWLFRHGAFPCSIAPYVISAEIGLSHHLPKIGGYVTRAQALASALSVAGFRLAPHPPHTNGFQILLPGSRASLEQACLQIAVRERVWLFPRLIESALDGFVMGEIQVGEALEDWNDDEVIALLQRLARAATCA